MPLLAVRQRIDSRSMTPQRPRSESSSAEPQAVSESGPQTSVPEPSSGRKLRGEPTELERERGRRFAQWLIAARQSRGFGTISALAEASGYSNTYLGVLENEGLNNATGMIQRPKEKIVEKLAEVTGASLDAGLEAAGYERRTPAPHGRIVLETGASYTLVANPTGATLELELTPELLNELHIHSELQKLRRERQKILDEMPRTDDND